MKKSTSQPPPSVRVAEMGVGYKAIRERFTTRVSLDRENRKIVAEYIARLTRVVKRSRIAL
jgi:ribosome-associated toxin RatA of RatAB toxin-antitoxin module